MKKIAILLIALMVIGVGFFSGCFELSGNPFPAVNICGTISTFDGNITITLSNEYLQAEDARIMLTTPENMTTSFDADIATADTIAGNTIVWVDVNGDGNVGGDGDIITVTAVGGLGAGYWYVRIVQKSSGLPAYYSGAIEIEENEPISVLPSITGVLDTVDGNITITLSGENLDGTDARIMLTAYDNNIISFEPPTTSASHPFYTISWIDASADGDVGSGDIIKITNTGGLSKGDWFVKIIQISSGKAAYDSSAIEVK